MGVVQKSSQNMIRWRLRMLMAEKNISNKELSELSGIHRTSISKHKNADELEQITGRVLNRLCNGLTRAYQARGDNKVITPGDLFEYTFDDDGYKGSTVQKDGSAATKQARRRVSTTTTKSSTPEGHIVPFGKRESA